VVVRQGEDDVNDGVGALSGPDVLLGDDASNLAGAAEEVLDDDAVARLFDVALVILLGWLFDL
jgi:hypothetical protein